MHTPASPEATVAHVARSAYGQLLAWLASRSGDLAGAEDALGDAMYAALRQWPEDGIPENPQAWILRAAQRKQIDARRRQRTREVSEDAIAYAAQLADNVGDDSPFPDDRLKLLFVCAHPAIDPSARTPLSLQAVMGLETERIAAAFLVSPTAMSQRLVRAKTKIRAARIPFQVPNESEWPERFETILDVIYAAFSVGSEGALNTDSGARGLAEEAVWLGRLLVRLVPDAPEALGLLALMLHSQARCAARRSADGAYIPLHLQDVGLWSRPLIDEAEAIIRAAAVYKAMGRYQIEAAIQSVHAERAVTGQTRWPVIVALYEMLVRKTPAIGARIGRALAIGELHGAKKGIVALDEIDASLVDVHQPYWAARAHLLHKSGRVKEADQTYQRAMGLTEDPAVRAFLASRMR